jgi:Rrf2 family protein
MASLVRVSEAASIALHACIWMARDTGACSRSKEICATLGFSQAHFPKVMQTLTRAGLVVSTRGPTGGTRLARTPDQITLLQVYEAVDGSAQTDRCLLAPEICPAACCKLGKTFARYNDELRHLLASETLADLARDFKAWPKTPATPCTTRTTTRRKDA